MPPQTDAKANVSRLTVGIVGGTGPQGRGLAYRLARGGQRVIIGSRDMRRGAGTAAELAAWPGISAPALSGGSNQQAATADIVIIALPYLGRTDTLIALRARLADRIVIDCANALTFDSYRRPCPVHVHEGSAAEQSAALLPASRVAAAFQHISAALLADPALGDLNTHVLVASDDAATAAQVQSLIRVAGMQGVLAGLLRQARQIEALTASLIAINGRHSGYDLARTHQLPCPRPANRAAFIGVAS